MCGFVGKKDAKAFTELASLFRSGQKEECEDSLRLSSRLPMGRDRIVVQQHSAAASGGDYSKKVVLATLGLSWGAGTLQQQSHSCKLSSEPQCDQHSTWSSLDDCADVKENDKDISKSTLVHILSSDTRLNN